mmetsp:Transcript_34362/g.75174  ORF Transcript_34362/g.75174 Transcript_34362/m.75174 type:complete len:289 (-) Transcript_34362:581-1447(-)
MPLGPLLMPVSFLKAFLRSRPVIVSTTSGTSATIRVTSLVSWEPAVPSLEMKIIFSVLLSGLAHASAMAGSCSTSPCRSGTLTLSPYIAYTSARARSTAASASPFFWTAEASASPMRSTRSASACAMMRTASALLRSSSSMASEVPCFSAFSRSTSWSVTSRITSASSTFCWVVARMTAFCWMACSMRPAANASSFALFTSAAYVARFSSRSRSACAMFCCCSAWALCASRVCSACTISLSLFIFATTLAASASLRDLPSAASRFTAAMADSPRASMYPLLSKMSVTV